MILVTPNVYLILFSIRSLSTLIFTMIGVNTFLASIFSSSISFPTFLPHVHFSLIPPPYYPLF